MPRGVYVRTKPAWNKGRVNLSVVAGINAVIDASPTPLTITEIYQAMVTAGTFAGCCHSLYMQLRRDRSYGLVDGSRIRNGRHDYHHGGHTGNGGIRKHQLGDKCRINPKGCTPKWLKAQLRTDVPRTIVATKSTPYHVNYYLGTNSLGNDVLTHRAFRASELLPFVKNTAPGRPRKKRAYIRQPVTACDSRAAHATLSPSISCVNCQELSVGKV